MIIKNSIYSSLAVNPDIDLSINDISLLDNISNLSLVEVNVEFENLGSSDANNVLVEFYSNSSFIENESLSILSNSKINVTFNLTNVVEGDYNLSVKILAFNDFIENSYSNNILSKIVNVVEFVCVPSWVLNDTWSECNTSDQQVSNWYDENNCGEQYNLSTSCYQESANVSNLCGGLSTGSYHTTGSGFDGEGGYNLFDGDWETHSRSEHRMKSSFLFINYTKPENITQAIWVVKDDAGVRNLSISQECFSYDSDTLRFNVESYNYPHVSFANWSCESSNGWLELSSIHESQYPNAFLLYEEGIWWNIGMPLYEVRSCDYCVSTWLNVNSSCGEDEIRNITYFYTNDCCDITGLLTDCNIPQNITESCDYCFTNLVNTSWSDWINISCLDGDVMNQSRNRTQYDSNYCGVIVNETFFEYRLGGYCDYCVEDMQYTSWTTWTNESCLVGDVMNQSKNRTYYDANYCGSVLNITEYEYQLDGYCDYCTPSWQCSPWSQCVDGWQTRTCIDSNNCGEDDNKPSEGQECEMVSRVEITLVDPSSDINVTRSKFFDFTTEVCCYDNDCNDVDVYLDPKQEVEYTPSTKTVCNDGICTKTLYSGIRFVNEDGEWKDVQKAKSLKGIWSVVKDEDSNYPVEVIDFNYSSIKLRLRGTKDSYLKVYGKYNKTKKLIDKKEERIDKIKGISVMSIDDDIEFIDLSEFGESILGQEIKWGGNSTFIQLIEPDTEILEDTCVKAYSEGDNNYGSWYTILSGSFNKFAYFKFNISYLSGKKIITSTFSVFGATWHGGNDKSIISSYDLYGVDDQSWLEGNGTQYGTNCTISLVCDRGITYNRRPPVQDLIAKGKGYNGTDYVFGFYTWNLNDYLETSLRNNNQNISMAVKLNHTSFNGNMELRIYSKEAPISYRPHLNITYIDSSKGLINTTIGAKPFYTINQNPITIDLDENECQEITWRVNATGDINTEHIFFTYSDFNNSYSESDRIKLTIVEDDIIDERQEIDILKGWNLISFMDTNDSMTIQLNNGWNLFGYSAEEPMLWQSVNITDGFDIKNTTDAGLSGWIQPIIYYFENGTYRFVPNNDQYLRKNKGYWLYVLEDNLNLILNGINTSSNPYYWANVTINNGTENKTLSDAKSLNWLQLTIYSYDDGYNFVPGDSDYVYPWRGYWLYSNKNLTLIMD